MKVNMDISEPSTRHLNAQSTTALYSQLCHLLRTRIESGELKPGQRLESERHLAAHYGISRMTVHQAMQSLTREGYIYAVQGRGLFVKGPKSAQAVHFTDLLYEAGPRTPLFTIRVLQAAVMDAEPDIATRLQIPEGDKVNFLKRLRVIQSLPLGVEVAYFPYKRFPNLFSNDPAQIPLYRTLATYLDIPLIHVAETINSACSTPEQQTLLELSDQMVLAVVERFTYDSDNQVVEYMTGTYRADSYYIGT